VSLSARDKKILIFLIPVVVLAAYWFLLFSPKREEASTAATALTEQQERLDAARSASQAAEGAQQNFDVTYAQVVRLGKAIPSDVDMPSVLVQLDAAAAGTGIQFKSITPGERVAVAPASPAPEASGDSQESRPVDAGGETAQSAPGGAVESANDASETAEGRSTAAEQTDVDTQTSTSSGGGLPVGGGSAPSGDAAAASNSAPAGLETVPLELEFEGNFFNLADFFHDVKRFVRVANKDVLVSGRLLTIEGVSWASDAESFPNLTATVNATVYLSPKAQGVTAGATPQGPAPSAPSDNTTPVETAPDPAFAPTATATPLTSP
jgi:Tfp pilus assembly protein PilO